MAKVTGLTVVRNGAAVDAEFDGHPGEMLIREGLAAMDDGHHRKAIELVMDGLELYAGAKNVSLPYDQS